MSMVGTNKQTKWIGLGVAFGTVAAVALTTAPHETGLHTVQPVTRLSTNAPVAAPVIPRAVPIRAQNQVQPAEQSGEYFPETAAVCNHIQYF